MSINFKILIISVFVLSISGCKSVQNNKPMMGKDLADKIESADYTFIPRMAISADGRALQLSSTFSLRISHDSIIADLPYYGRAYVSSRPPAESGIKFISSKFDYNIEKNDNGCNINISTLDKDTKFNLLLTINNKGNASLTINENSRQSIVFYGGIE